MSLQQLTSANAHRLIAELITLGILPPADKFVATARSESDGIEVVITVLPCKSTSKHKGPGRLTPQQKKIVALLEGQPARKANWIAIKLGKRSADGGLRAMLSEMVSSGSLIKGADGYGYCLPPKTSEA